MTPPIQIYDKETSISMTRLIRIAELEAEVARLTAENKALKNEIRELERPSPPYFDGEGNEPEWSV